MVAMATNSNITVPQKYTTKFKNVGYGWDTSHPTTISKKFIILIYHYLHAVKKVEEVPLSKPINALVGGKSTLQNEIFGDLNLEFTAAPEKGEELPLDKLGSSLGSGYSGQLGKHTTGLISRLVGGKMPGGFNLTSIKGYLNKTWGLGPLRSDGVTSWFDYGAAEAFGLRGRSEDLVGQRHCGVRSICRNFPV